MPLCARGWRCWRRATLWARCTAFGSVWRRATLTHVRTAQESILELASAPTAPFSVTCETNVEVLELRQRQFRDGCARAGSDEQAATCSCPVAAALTIAIAATVRSRAVPYPAALLRCCCCVQGRDRGGAAVAAGAESAPPRGWQAAADLARPPVLGRTPEAHRACAWRCGSAARARPWRLPSSDGWPVACADDEPRA